ICFLLFMAFLMKPIGTLNDQDRREVRLFRGCWFGTIALAVLSTALLSQDDPKLAVTKSIVAVGSALLMWLVASLQPDGYLQAQFFGASEKSGVWWPVMVGLMFFAAGVFLLLTIGDKPGRHGLVFSVVIAMGGFMLSGFLFRIAFRNFQRK
ncbi:MAG: hypothetical protein Q8N17_03360, partial [Burkholderiaceae bacterium]|nr:hypothetical protein [Burkholderiaceae bacterium]